MSRSTLSLIAAVARNGGIGKNNELLAHLPGDLPRFKATTLGCPLIMGRKTWDSIGGKPLPGRRNIVLTRQAQWQAVGADAVSSLADALDLVSDAPKVFVIGGAEIYALAVAQADELVLTEIDADLEADAFFPTWDRRQFAETARETRNAPQGFDYSFVTYQRLVDG